MLTLMPQQAIELYTVREMPEGLAARLAIEHANGETLQRMSDCLQKQYEVVQKEDLVSYSWLDYDFHAIVYEASGNRTLQEMLETIKNKMRPIAMHIKPVLSSLYGDHLEILEAFKSKDPDRAEAAFRNHNHQMIAQIKNSLLADEWKKEGSALGAPVRRPWSLS